MEEKQTEDIETSAIARANIIVNFNVFLDISDSETLDDRLQQLVQCNV